MNRRDVLKAMLVAPFAGVCGKAIAKTPVEFEEIVSITTKETNAAKVYLASGLPARFQRHCKHRKHTVRRISLSRSPNNEFVWTAKVHYSSASLTE